MKRNAGICKDFDHEMATFKKLTEPADFLLAGCMGSEMVDFASVAVFSDVVTRCVGNEMGRCSVSSSHEVSE